MSMNTSFTTRLIVIGLIALSLSACAAPAPPMPAQPAVPAPAADAASAVNQTANPAQATRLIIRTADLTLIVKDTQTQLDAINKIATDSGGFVVSSSTSRYENDALQGQVVLRVDAKQFDVALNSIRKLAVEVRNESVRGEDVTAEYVDLEAQLRNLEAAEQQLLEIMKQATKTEDVLAVYQQLTQIRGQIEQIKGRMKYLSQSAALATISVNLIPDELAQPVQVAGWRPEGVAKTAVEALIATLQGLATIVIWFVIVVVPILALFALPVVILVLLIRRSRKTKTVKAA